MTSFEAIITIPSKSSLATTPCVSFSRALDNSGLAAVAGHACGCRFRSLLHSEGPAPCIPQGPSIWAKPIHLPCGPAPVSFYGSIKTYYCRNTQITRSLQEDAPRCRKSVLMVSRLPVPLLGTNSGLQSLNRIQIQVHVLCPRLLSVCGTKQRLRRWRCCLRLRSLLTLPYRSSASTYFGRLQTTCHLSGIEFRLSRRQRRRRPKSPL